jgi:hydrogenase nickel incorporation protein HypB
MCKDCGCSTAKHKLFSAFQTNHHHDPSLPRISLSTKKRRIFVEESLFEKNQNLARANRRRFQSQNLVVFNVMSSPGAGKTTLLSRILPKLALDHRLAVIVGDQETSIDADRLRAAGVAAFQINTHSACHLDAKRVIDAVDRLDLDDLDWLVIENVGNLVCPAVFDLGEKFRIALLSTTEGEEKPLKYPVLFHEADLIVISKSDLLPYLDLNQTILVENLRKMNVRAPIIFCSSKTGEGFEQLTAEIHHLATGKEISDVCRNANPHP